MANEDLLNYIKDQSGRGISREEIIKTLANAGWQQRDINEAFAATPGKVPTTPVAAAPTTTITPASKSKNKVLIGIVALIVAGGAAFGVYYYTKGSGSSSGSTSNNGSDNNAPASEVVTVNPEFLSKLDTTPYTNSAERFSIRPPKGWKIDETSQALLVRFINQKPDQEGSYSFTANMNITSAPAMGSTLDSYLTSAEDILKIAFPNFKASEKKKISVNGLEMVYMTGTYTMTKELRILQVAILKDDNAYVITGTALESTQNKYLDLMETSAFTFTPLD